MNVGSVVEQQLDALDVIFLCSDVEWRCTIYMP